MEENQLGPAVISRTRSSSFWVEPQALAQDFRPAR